MSRPKFFSALAGKLLIALCMATAMSAAAEAGDERRHEAKHHSKHQAKHHAKHHHEHRKSSSASHHHGRPPLHRDYRDSRHHGPGPDWRYYEGRYWAPAHYRGRRCDDRRHYHGVHFHVASRDYYEYYYPRYRVHGPITPSANLIITLPLF